MDLYQAHTIGSVTSAGDSTIGEERRTRSAPSGPTSPWPEERAEGTQAPNEICFYRLT